MKKFTDLKRQMPSQMNVIDPLLPAQKPTVVEGNTLKDDWVPDELLKALQNEPDYPTFVRSLEYLNARLEEPESSLRVPNAYSALLINELVTVVIPNFWEFLNTSSDRDGLLALVYSCLRSPGAIRCIVLKLRTFVSNDIKNDKSFHSPLNKNQEYAEIYLCLLSGILGPGSFLHKIWRDNRSLITRDAQREVVWKDFAAIVASGTIVSLAAEAEDKRRLQDGPENILPFSWLLSGTQYSSWLGLNIAYMAHQVDADDSAALQALAGFLGKAMDVGYPNAVVEKLLHTFFQSQLKTSTRLSLVISRLSLLSQRLFLQSTLHIIAGMPAFASERATEAPQTLAPELVSAYATKLFELFNKVESVWDFLEDMTIYPDEVGAIPNLSLNRVTACLIAQADHRLERVLQKSIDFFSDKAYISRTPMVLQESAAQILLLTAGHLYYTKKDRLLSLIRSNTYTTGVSNRLSAGSERARFLGMVVASAISQMCDTKDLKLMFEFDERLKLDVDRYLYLTKVPERVKVLKDFTLELELFGQKSSPTTSPADMKTSKPRAKKNVVALRSKADIVAIPPPEVSTLEADMKPYSKPDSDPEDDDDDPTLIRRDKPTAPIYIRDLISGLRNQPEDIDRFDVTLKTAPSLIRRKAGFGKELIDNLDDLVNLLLGLQDTYELEEFEDLRQQSLIALFLAYPVLVGRTYVGAVFSGDFSLNQRTSILTAIGMGARQLAGFDDESKAKVNETVNKKLKEIFPSEKLPEKFSEIYGTQKSYLENVAQKVERSLIEPAAQKAIEKHSGPKVLNIIKPPATVEMKKSRKKAAPNMLANIAADTLLLPLMARFWILFQADYRDRNTPFLKSMIPIILKTIAILIHASGPSLLALPEITTQFWQLLISLRNFTAYNLMAEESILFGLMILLEVNEDKHALVAGHARSLVETHEWANMVFSRTGGTEDEGNRIRMLAATILIKTQEILQSYQEALKEHQSIF